VFLLRRPEINLLLAGFAAAALLNRNVIEGISSAIKFEFATHPK